MMCQRAGKFFLSTLSLRRATILSTGSTHNSDAFYPRSPCGERQANSRAERPKQHLSIHALLAESDRAANCQQRNHHLSIHALLAESDNRRFRPVQRPKTFYPRSPCGERRPRQIIIVVINTFYPRSPCGERPVVPAELTTLVNFLSTLSLRRATHAYQLVLWVLRFLSTLSLRRATPTLHNIFKLLTFLSTLSLRRATLAPKPKTKATDFYPRSPCGERRDVIAVMTDAQSISIHALLAESDTKRLCNTLKHLHFYPRSPCGERRNGYPHTRRRDAISIHALLAESDVMDTLILADAMLFLSTLSLRRAT